MVEQDTPTPAGGPPSYASASAVAGLAREVEALRRAVDDLTRTVQAVDALPGRVENLAGVVSRLTAKVAAKKTAGTRTVSWLVLDPADVDAEQLLAALADWLQQVFLRYADAARALPDCWLWHPEIVEELLWLWVAWLAAYDDPDAKPSAAADWHDRLRPGVVRRIRDVYARSCSIDNHTEGRDRHHAATPVPLADAIPAIAEWWTNTRDHAAPAPTEQQLARAAGTRPHTRTRTRP